MEAGENVVILMSGAKSKGSIQTNNSFIIIIIFFYPKPTIYRNIYNTKNGERLINNDTVQTVPVYWFAVSS